MAIHDALWACPFCRRIESIRPGKGADRCSACGATFEAGPGARIVATPGGGPSEARSLEEWEQRLPALDTAAEANPGPASAIVRTAGPTRPVYDRAQLLGWAERFGPKTRATVRLEDDALVVRPQGGPEDRWPLHQVTAVQPSSSSVQLRRKDGRLMSLAFPDGSVRLWEARLQGAVRTSYRTAGKGEITDFHPTIRTR